MTCDDPNSVWLQIAFGCNSSVEQHVFSERQLMTSSLALLQSKVWLRAPRYQVWDEPEMRWTRDNFQRHSTYYATKTKPFRHSEIIISLTNDSSKVLRKRLSGPYCVIRLFVTSSRSWATSSPLRGYTPFAAETLWPLILMDKLVNLQETIAIDKRQCWSWHNREITTSQWVKEAYSWPQSKRLHNCPWPDRLREERNADVDKTVTSKWTKEGLK